MPHTQEQNAALQNLLHLLLGGVTADGALVTASRADDVSSVLAASPAGLAGRRLPLSAAVLAVCETEGQPTADLLLPSAITGWLGFRPAFVAAAKLKLGTGEGCLFFWWEHPPADPAGIMNHVHTAANLVADAAAQQAAANQLQQMQDRMDVLLEHVSLGLVFVDSLRGSLLNAVAADIFNLPPDTRDTPTVVAAMQAIRASCQIEKIDDEATATTSSAEYWISPTRKTVHRVESHAVGNFLTPGRFWVFTDVKPLWESKERTRAANSVLARNINQLGEEMDRRIDAEEQLRQYNIGLKQQNEELEVAKLQSDLLANQDPLTGLANRRRFRRELEDIIATARVKGDSVVVLYLDLDKFKAVNDTLGHERGDELLRTVADTLSDVLRKGDMVARLGGDEFACALSLPSGNSPEELAPLLEKISNSLKIPVDCGDRIIPVSATIGLAVFPQDANDAAALLRAADNAMYVGKRSGGNELVAFSTNAVAT